MKNTCNGINNTLDIAKEKISEGKGMKIKIIQNKTRGEKRTEKHIQIKSTDELGSISSNLKMGNWIPKKNKNKNEREWLNTFQTGEL